MMPSFEYVRARSVNEAMALLSVPNARIHAGGTDLLGCMRDKIFPVGRVVAVKDLPGLSGIKENHGDVTVGALTTVAQLAASPVVASFFPASPWLPERWQVPSFGTKARSGAICARNRAAGITAAISIVSGRAAITASP